MEKIPLLKQNDWVQIVAPARKISLPELQPSIDLFTQRGYRVKVSNLAMGQYHQFSGTDAQRTTDFQDAVNDVDVKAIVCARGGYGGIRIVDAIDFSPLKQHPKWICGYSDTTVFHAHLHTQLQMPTLHATMPVNITASDFQTAAVQTWFQAMETGALNYQLPSNELNRYGTSNGQLIGGNLSILYAINGSPSDFDTKGKILFIEDLDEYLYHIDRMMVCLKRSGKLASLAGLVVGGMTDMHDNEIPFGKTAKEIVHQHVKEYDYPVCFDFPAGHIKNNNALIFGAKTQLNVNEKGVTLKIEL